MPATSIAGGRLVAVGLGIELGRHVSQRALSEIQAADVVFALVDAFALQWLQTLHPQVHNLCEHYDETVDRRHSYRAMEAALLADVHRGKRVCAVLYGHPGVFAVVAHRAIEAARRDGYDARMEPGVSAEACLYADLGLDPGWRGVQSCEATQFLIQQRTIDPAALLLLWQVALAGNLDCTGFQSVPACLEVLSKKLQRWYRPDTEVILYEAARLPIETFRADHLALADLPAAEYREHTTLVIPPDTEPSPDQETLTQLKSLILDP